MVQTWSDEEPRAAALADALGDVELFSVRAPDPATEDLPRRVEGWVDRAVEVLDAMPVDPPYRIVGWSFGGVVAVELARRLGERGVPVAFVGMIDTTRPRLRPLDATEYVWFHLGAAAALTDRRARGPYLRRRLLALAARRFPRTGRAAENLAHRLRLRARPAKPLGTRPSDPLTVSIHTSYLNYRGDPVPFPVGLYATTPSLRRRPEAALRWAGHLHGGFELVEIAGDHYGCFDPEHVGVLASALRRSLDRADADAAGDADQTRATSAS